MLIPKRKCLVGAGQIRCKESGTLSNKYLYMIEPAWGTWVSCSYGHTLLRVFHYPTSGCRQSGLYVVINDTISFRLVSRKIHAGTSDLPDCRHHCHVLAILLHTIAYRLRRRNPDSNVHGANMGPTWVLSTPDGPHVGPMNVAIREVMFMGGNFPSSVAAGNGAVTVCLNVDTDIDGWRNTSHWEHDHEC